MKLGFTIAFALAQVMPLAALAAAPSPKAPDPLAGVEDVPGLPRVLLIGDSVSMGYTLTTRELLKGRANVHRPPTNCSSTGNGLKNLKTWLGDKKWDVIHFNFGLHDAKLPPEGVRHAPPELYEKNLRALVAGMKATGAQLIFATTTPVPNDGNLSPIRRFGSVDVYNDVARKVMNENGVFIDDLNAVIAPHVATMQRPNDVHFTEEGSSLLAKQVAQSIQTRLANTGIAFRQEPDRLVFTHRGQPLGEFVFRDPKILRPYLANLHAPDGTLVTRTHPPVAGVDATDHDTMHPGIWLGFGDISGHDFWRNKGRIVHQRFVEPPAVQDGVLSFSTESEMVTADGQPLAMMMSTIVIAERTGAWRITWDATIIPKADGFYFGDQEEMGLGARVATAITEKNGGVITSSAGTTTAKATWGKPAAWCDYSRVIGGKHAGIMIIPDPANPHSSWWHNRDYGVFVSNPFGRKSMKQGEVSQIKVKSGETYRLRHTILLHSGSGAVDHGSLLQ